MFLVTIAPPTAGIQEDYLYRFDPAEGLELSEYSRGGTIGTCYWLEGRELRGCLRRRQAARRFIYDHWRSKQRAYIAIHFPCDDCSPTMHVFIEPNEAGEWRIAIFQEEPRYPVRRSPDAFRLIYRKAEKVEPWPEQARRVLSFRDVSNVEVDSF